MSFSVHSPWEQHGSEVTLSWDKVAILFFLKKFQFQQIIDITVHSATPLTKKCCNCGIFVWFMALWKTTFVTFTDPTTVYCEKIKSKKLKRTNSSVVRNPFPLSPSLAVSKQIRLVFYLFLIRPHVWLVGFDRLWIFGQFITRTRSK